MKDQEQQNHTWTRRGFLRGASLAGVGGAVGALADRPIYGANPKPPQTVSSPTAYDLDRLRKVDPALVRYEQIGTIKSPYPEPKRIVVGPHEQLYISAGPKICVLSIEGAHGTEISLSEEVRCLAVAKDGAIYAGLKEQIEIYSAAGQKTGGWDGPMKKPWFTGLAVGEKDVFGADAANRLVVRWDRSGKLLGRIGEKDRAKGRAGFLVPSPYFDLELGPDRLLWVANPGYHRLEAYAYDGEMKSFWGEASFGITGFCGCCNPAYFTRLPDGRFVTSEKGLARIKIYSAKGEFECVVAAPESFPKYFENPNATPVAMDVAADSAGRILVADTLGNEIRIFRKKT